SPALISQDSSERLYRTKQLLPGQPLCCFEPHAFVIAGELVREIALEVQPRGDVLNGYDRSYDPVVFAQRGDCDALLHLVEILGRGRWWTREQVMMERGSQYYNDALSQYMLKRRKQPSAGELGEKRN